MEQISAYLVWVRELIWGIPLLFFLLGTGVYLTILLRGVQFRYLGYAIEQIFGAKHQGAEGDINHFESLMTTLAGAIGTGAIVGVATGVKIGGMGSLFWMWVTALLGMATKYAESLLAVKYREKDRFGEMIGGPMEYIGRGLGWKWMAALFAGLGVFAAIGTGNLVQVNSIAHALSVEWQVNPWLSGCIIAFFLALVLVGGIKSIGRVAGVLVPIMALFYLSAGLIVILYNFDQIPAALGLIFKEAFQGPAMAGGMAGGGLLLAIQMGVARSVFSNEAGLGISSIASAAAQTDAPPRQAMIAMTGALLSTIVICTITGLAIAVTGALEIDGANGAALAIYAFRQTFGLGGTIVSIGLILFAFSTIIAWAYYGEKCCEYLFGSRSIMPFRLFFILVIIPGAAIEMDLVWHFADIANGLMMIPNLIALLGLSSVIVLETNQFLEKRCCY